MSSLSISESFRKRADSAAFYEAWAGSVLARAGLYTVHHPFTLADQVERSRASYAHTWDMDVSTTHPATLNHVAVLVEVKSVNLTFHHTKDYPFGTVLVCSQASFLKKWPGRSRTGRDFLFVSRETGCIVWLPSGTTVEIGHEVYDGSRRELYKVVKCARSSLAELDDFVDYVKKPWPEPRDEEPETPRVNQ
jgi:hypothetical protein